MQLHVWGNSAEVSPLFPECVASAWLLSATRTDYVIITSSNTDISDTRSLPVLIADDGTKHHGFTDIARFLLSDPLSLTDYALINACNSKLLPIHLYNVYVSRTNYQQHTRPLLSSYLSFPFMYNVPTRLQAAAVEHAKLIGLGSDASIASEGIDEDDKSPTLGALHNLVRLSKAKQQSALRETKMSMRCSRLLKQSLNEILAVESITLLRPSHTLVCAYIHCLSLSVADSTVRHTIASEFSHLQKLAEKESARHSGMRIRSPHGDEVGNVLNTVRHAWSRRYEPMLYAV